MRAVLDVNVLIAAMLSPGGSPAGLLREWRDGAFDLVVSPALLAELGRALAYPKLAKRFTRADAGEFVGWLSRSAVMVPDPGEPPAARSAEPADDDLIALAAAADAWLVSGDSDLLDLADRIPVLPPGAFVARLAASTS